MRCIQTKINERSKTTSLLAIAVDGRLVELAPSANTAFFVPFIVEKQAYDYSIRSFKNLTQLYNHPRTQAPHSDVLVALRQY